MGVMKVSTVRKITENIRWSKISTGIHEIPMLDLIGNSLYILHFCRMTYILFMRSQSILCKNNSIYRKVASVFPLWRLICFKNSCLCRHKFSGTDLLL